MTTPPDQNSTNADCISARIVDHPGTYTPGMLALAQAYESQRERISDLEDDVERLRPREAFKPERIFTYGSEGRDLEFFTECQGGLTIYSSDSTGSGPDFTLSQDIATQLTTALLKWSGVDGVGWREIGEGKPDGVKDLVDVLLTDGTKTGVGCWCPDWSGWNWPGVTITHWAPLPKPPEVKS